MNINLKCKKEPFEIKPNKEKANELMYMYLQKQQTNEK